MSDRNDFSLYCDGVEKDMYNRVNENHFYNGKKSFSSEEVSSELAYFEAKYNQVLDCMFENRENQDVLSELRPIKRNASATLSILESLSIEQEFYRTECKSCFDEKVSIIKGYWE